MSGPKAVTVVGIGADGCAGLSSRAVNAVSQAHILVGGERHLSYFPQFEGERVVLGNVAKVLPALAERAAESTVCVLASGDPLFFGVGRLVVKTFGAEHVAFLPHPTSVQWAFAHVGETWESARFVSAHGRALEGLVMRLRGAQKAAVLTDEENSPARIAAHFLAYGDADWTAWVCERVGGPGERVRRFSMPDLASLAEVDPLNLLLLKRPEAFRASPAIPFLPEEAFEKRMPKKGLITKREARTLSLAAMGIRPSSVVWDVGAGSGAVAIEAAMLAPEGRVYAVEVDPEGAALCRANARAHGADNVRVVEGRAPEALAGLEPPDAVFVGGSKGSMEDIVRAAVERGAPGARIVVNAITLENVAEAYRAFRTLGIAPEVTMLNVARAEPLAHYMRWAALNPIHIFVGEKPGEPPADKPSPTPPPPPGRLFGVGVGPGAPDLLTVRAVNTLRAAPVLAIPRRNPYTPSVAWRIAEPAVGDVPGQERLFLHFPMTKDPTILRPAWAEAFDQIGERLLAGKDVAFLTEGDPFVYSTFIYLLEAASVRWPGVKVEVVPAVSSITAVPAVTGIPLADGQERIAILPATYGVDDLAEVLSKFDTTVLMKVSSVMPDVVEALERTGLLDKAVYVSKATTSEQRIVRDVASIRNDRCDYFSMVIVSKKERSGVLAGTVGQ